MGSVSGFASVSLVAYLSLEFHLDGVALVISSSSLDFSPSITIWQLIKLYRELKVLGGSGNLAMLFSLFSAHVCHEISFGAIYMRWRQLVSDTCQAKNLKPQMLLYNIYKIKFG